MSDMDHYRWRLEKRREELRHWLEKIGADLHQPGDRDLEDQAIQRENDEVLEQLDENAAEELVQIASALERIRNRTYGYCVSCGTEISRVRLDAVPTASRCRECAR